MDLDKLAIRVICALLIKRRLCRSGTDHRVGRFPKDGSNSTGGYDHRVGREGAHFHRAQIHGTDAATDTLTVEYGGEELPGFEFADSSFGFVAPHLLIERIQQLLASGCSREGGAVIESSAKTAKIEQSFRGAIEGNAHAIEKIDNCGRSLAHVFYGRLIGKEVAAVNSVVKVLPRSVALTLQVLRGVDPALRAHRV